MMAAVLECTIAAGFLQELRINVPQLEHVSAGRLIAQIDRAWHHRDALRGRIRDALPTLQQRARLNNEVAVQVLTALAGRRGEPRGAEHPAP